MEDQGGAVNGFQDGASDDGAQNGGSANVENVQELAQYVSVHSLFKS